MRIVKQITDNRFLNIKEVTDHDLRCTAYQFAERKGVDSVAFICYDKEKGLFLINKEATPPTGGFMLRAFGGSIDKSKPYEEIVRDEVLEEAGYKIPPSKIKLVGRSFVSTQMNQFCYLFIVFISDDKKTARHPENECEALASLEWRLENEIMDGEDWKAITIIEKAKRKGLL